MWLVSDGLRLGCDRAGLVWVLDWLTRLLKFEYPDEAESDGV